MITGRSASRSSATARSSMRPSGVAAGCGNDSAGSASSASMKTWSSGKSTNAGPECGRSAASQASSISPGISAVEEAVVASLTSGRTNCTWSTSCSDPRPQRSAGARPPSISIGEWLCCADPSALMPLVTPGPGGERADARFARDLGPALGGERGGGLVAHVDQLDPLRPAAVVDREQMPARQREDHLDPVRLEPAGHEPAAVQLRRLLWLRGHRVRNIPPDRGCGAPRARHRCGARLRSWHGSVAHPAERPHARSPISTCSTARRSRTLPAAVPPGDVSEPETVDAFNAQILAGLVSP